MAELAPVDEYGMPLLLHPYDPPGRRAPTWRDDDHSFYQRNAEELRDAAGQALRLSRVQTVERWLHNNKHRAFPDGTHLPETEQQKFTLTVMACAGYVSRLALDVRKPDKPELVQTSASTHAFLQGRRQLHVEMRKDLVIGYKTESLSKKKIGQFFADYVRRQEIDGIDQAIIDQFLNTPSDAKREHLGNKILGHAIRVAVDPVLPTYYEIREKELVRPVLIHPFKVITSIFPKTKWPQYHDDLQSRLAS